MKVEGIGQVHSKLATSAFTDLRQVGNRRARHTSLHERANKEVGGRRITRHDTSTTPGGTAEAAPLYRFDQPRTHNRSATKSDATTRFETLAVVAASVATGAQTTTSADATSGPAATSAATTTGADVTVSAELRASVDDAVLNADAAVQRARDALAASADPEAVAWETIADLADAEVGLDAAAAQLTYVRAQLTEQGAAAEPGSAAAQIDRFLAEVSGLRGQLV